MNSVAVKSSDTILAIDFLGVFFSILKKKNKNVVSSQRLLDVIGRHSRDFLDIFLNIDVRDNCGVYFSQDIEEGITMLQIIGAVSKANPRYEKIILKLDKDSADDIISDCEQSVYKRICEFTDIYLSESYN